MKLKAAFALLAAIVVVSVSSCKSKQTCPAYGKVKTEKVNRI
jgi:hypothetical protein